MMESAQPLFGAGDGVRISESDVLIIGSGAAGMTVALACPFGRVTLLTKTEGLTSGSTHWAQGGIAAAVGADDDPARHAEDTVAVGHELVDPVLARLLAEDGKAAIEKLISDGFPADLGGDGLPVLSREAAHSRRRVVHAGGDATGRHLSAYLASLVEADPRISVVRYAMAVEIVRQGGRCVGVLAHGPRGGWVFHRAPRIVLATGGIGQVFGATTNPAECTGDGLALAARAGCSLIDTEFVQFHPTALTVQGANRQHALLTEALRGDGAVLLDGQGRRFMTDVHPDRELAPRDVVARAIWRVISEGGKAFLDLRAVMRNGGATRFPTVVEICRKAGLDPFLVPIPVAPVAHYHMGGVATDENGRSDLPGLWACGEVACTGVHGANRLASNSLLEALVFGGRVAKDLADADPGSCAITGIPRPSELPSLPASTVAGLRNKLTAEMYRGAGMLRDEAGMTSTLRTVCDVESILIDARRTGAAIDPGSIRDVVELSNMAIVSKTVLVAALQREESRGAHARSDCPDTAPTAIRNRLTSDDVDAIAARWCSPSYPIRVGGAKP